MDIREALYTTRAMRRVKPDPIPEDVQMRILDAAIRAPSGGNGQQWRFMLVDDPATRAELGEHYRYCIDQLWSTVYAEQAAAAADPQNDSDKQFGRVLNRAAERADGRGGVRGEGLSIEDGEEGRFHRTPTVIGGRRSVGGLKSQALVNKPIAVGDEREERR